MDIIDALPQRRRAGEITHERVGRRGRTGPGSERRRRLFDRLGVADPYDPDAKDRPIELGPVALKLTGKREPAPHAKIRPRKSVGETDPASFRPRVPSSPKPAPRPTPRPKSAPTAAAPEGPPPGPAGAPRLPVRPQADSDETESPARPLIPERPASETQDRRRAGRFRLQRTEAHGPKERKAAEREPLVEPVAAPSTPPPRRGPRDGGLDDLFGFSGEGRMRQSRKDSEEPGKD